jgi:Spy/CpxP family protein refolding chaperone
MIIASKVVIMKHNELKAPLISLAAVLSLAFASASTYSQTSDVQNQTAPTTQTQNAPPQAAPAQSLPAQLNFTPQQAQQWREINREFRDQEMAANLKFRQARLALNEAMESQSPNEGIIKQRAKDVADAQSALTQLQALRQARVLQILTPEQRVKLKQIRDRAQAFRREQKGGNALAPNRQMRPNANAPLLTPAQRKALRQQQPKQKP